MEPPVRLHGAGFAAPAPAKAAPARRAGGRPATGRTQKERGMLRLDDEMFARLTRQAERTGKPKAEIIRAALDGYLPA